MVIAMDGPACAGKSTLAVMTAEKLGINFLNTGMIFRAIAYLFDKDNIDVSNLQEVENELNNANIDVEYIKNEQVVYVDSIDTRPFISLPNISEKSSLYSQIKLVREMVLSIQRKFSKKYDLVVEGRDIGTEVFPNAEYKFFITANIDVRSQRRYDTLKQKNPDITLDEVKQMLKERDYNDTNRKISPLKMAEDAIKIDTSNSTIQESLNEILSYIK